MKFQIAGTEEVRIHGDGTLAVPSGILLDPGQLSGATTNILDEYEEGTFTPALGRTGSQPTVTYSNQAGKYTRVGNMVLIWFDMSHSSKSGGSGMHRISGLPFNAIANNTTGGYGSPQFRNCTAWNHAAQQAPSTYHGTTFIYLRYMSDGTTENDITISGSGRMTGWSVYFTDE